MATCTHFTFYRRNPYHWDVGVNKERAFAIRGGPHDAQWSGDGTFRVRDERSETRDSPREIQAIRFPDLASAVAWITSALMAEDQPQPKEGNNEQ